MMWDKFRNFWYNKIQGKQFIPTEEDVKEVKKLMERLKGKDDVETLNNILEWQERNISYWWERFPFDISFKIMIPFAGILLFMISLPLLVLLRFLNETLFLFTTVILVVLLISFVFSRTTGKIYYLLLGLPIVCLSTVLILRIPSLHRILFYSFFYIGCIFVFLVILFYLYIRYRKIEKVSFWEILNDTFSLNLPVSKIIKYRLAVCRDYAKLTASLLLNLYPNNRIFFFTFPGHVSAGIEINRKTYILDQRLPILNETAWLILRNRKHATKLELKRKNGMYFVDYIGKVSLKGKSELQNLKDLIEEIEKAIKSGKRKVAYTLKGKAKVYDVEDEIIEGSLLRKIKLILENEMVGNFSKIKELKIKKHDDDILLEIYLGDGK